MKYLGIDFGTTFTKAAIFDTETRKVSLVCLNPNSVDFGFGQTKYAMPTAVAVQIQNEKRDYFVGVQARNMFMYPNTYYFEQFKPQIDHKEEKAQTSPDILYVDLIKSILEHVKQCAKKEYSCPFNRVVITVPASTIKGGYRWQRMLEAAKSSFGDSMPIDIIYEPEAAGYALIKQALKFEKGINNKSFLIYDFGGGTFDASVFKVIDEQIFVVEESIGSDDQRRWGGIYIDDILRSDYLKNGETIKKMIQNASNLDLRGKKQLQNLLQTEPTRAKIALTSSESFKYQLGDYIINRKYYERMIDPMISETIESTRDLLSEEEEEGCAISLKDVEKLYLVGGSAKIPLILNSWESTKRQESASFKIEVADIEIVAIGAAMYNYLKIDNERLIELGIQRLKSKDYGRAALYFRNSESPMGDYLLGTLYYNGVIGHRVNYANAIKYFKKSDNEYANAMLALCAFQGKKGLPRDHQMAKQYLQKGGSLQLTKKISEALTSTPSQSTLDYIYDFDPVKDALNSFKFEIDKTKIESMNKANREVYPTDPDLDVFKLMGW